MGRDHPRPLPWYLDSHPTFRGQAFIRGSDSCGRVPLPLCEPRPFHKPRPKPPTGLPHRRFGRGRPSRTLKGVPTPTPGMGVTHMPDFVVDGPVGQAPEEGEGSAGRVTVGGGEEHDAHQHHTQDHHQVVPAQQEALGGGKGRRARAGVCGVLPGRQQRMREPTQATPVQKP